MAPVLRPAITRRLESVTTSVTFPVPRAVGGDPATAALVTAARRGFHPNAVYAFGDGASPSERPLLKGKGLVNGLPAVYICERFACRAPLTDPSAVAEALR